MSLQDTAPPQESVSGAASAAYPIASTGRTAGASEVDLRSDTVTRPSKAMRQAMAEALVGDDVYGEDGTVCELETRIAALFGFEAGLFMPTGTQSNLAAMLTHCGRGDEILVGADNHIASAEASGASVLGGIALCALPIASDGALEPDSIAAAVKPDDFHFATTRLLCVENTIGGRAVPLARHDAAIDAGRAEGLAVHLDGARVFNAAAALNVAPARLAQGCDSVSVCLSKGLGAPAGSVLCGTAAFVASAKRWRKMLGGGMRQSGVLAAAGLHALDHHVTGLAKDHARASRLRDALATMPGLHVDRSQGQTNMVWATLEGLDADAIAEELARHGVVVSPGRTLRLVLHRDIDDDGLERAIEAFAAATAKYKAS